MAHCCSEGTCQCAQHYTTLRGEVDELRTVVHGFFERERRSIGQKKKFFDDLFSKVDKHN